jgi:hypothetical protein
MQLSAHLASQLLIRTLQDICQVVSVQVITRVNLILTVCLSVWTNVRHALFLNHVRLVNKRIFNKTLEILHYVIALLVLIQHLIIIAQIVWIIVKLVQMQHLATRANQHPPRLLREFCQHVTVQVTILASQIMIVYQLVC